MFTTYPLPAEVADVVGYEVSPANSYCSGTGKRSARSRSVARTVSSRRRIRGRAMELVSGHEPSMALSNRGALSILDASFKIGWVLLRFRRAIFTHPSGCSRGPLVREGGRVEGCI